MVFLIAGAAAGYMYYKRKKAEREAAEKGVSTEGCTDNVNDINTAASSDENDTPSCSPRGSQGEPVGPVGKFLRFCENLEKEVEKARERQRRELIAEAFDEALKETYKKKQQESRAVSTKPIVEKDADAGEKVAATTFAKKKEKNFRESDYPMLPLNVFDDGYQFSTGVAVQTSNRPRIATE